MAVAIHFAGIKAHNTCWEAVSWQKLLFGKPSQEEAIGAIAPDPLKAPSLCGQVLVEEIFPRPSACLLKQSIDDCLFTTPEVRQILQLGGTFRRESDIALAFECCVYHQLAHAVANALPEALIAGFLSAQPLDQACRKGGFASEKIAARSKHR
jgi:hypothetical protein